MKPGTLESFASRTELTNVQLSKITALLKEILPANRFYERKLSGRNTSLIHTLADYSSTVPFTTKHELIRDRLEHPPYGTGLTYPLENYIRCHQTSGSTAVPIRWLDTQASWAQLVRNWEHIFDAAGVNSSDRLFFAFSFGPFLGFWTALESALGLGYFCFTSGGMNSVARLQAILDNRITVLCCTPTYAQHLAAVAHEKKIDLSRGTVRLIIVAGEPGGSIPATRTRIEQLWTGAKVFDHHGMTEVGPVTYQCPTTPGVLHVLEHAYLAEIIDPHTTAGVSPGQIGELVLTTLIRAASPLLRYRTGDLVKARPATTCECGHVELAFEGGVVGRTDDMVVVHGVNVYPSLVEELIRSHPDVLEYRVELDSRSSMTEMSIDVETSSSSSFQEAALNKRIQDALQTALHLRVPVRCVAPGTLPRYEMKARRWVKVTEGVV